MSKGKIVQMRNFPEDLHRRAKVFAAQNDTTVKAVVIKALTEYLDRHEGKGA